MTFFAFIKCVFNRGESTDYTLSAHGEHGKLWRIRNGIVPQDSLFFRPEWAH